MQFGPILLAFLSIAAGTGSVVAQRSLLPDSSPLYPEAPHAAVGVDGSVAVAFAVGDAIWCSASPQVGGDFGEPVRVGAAGKLEHGITRGPKVAVAGKTLVVAAICGEKLRGRDGDLLAWRSADRGRTWSGPERVNDVAAAAREGLHALAADSDGRLLCVWLDLRGEGTELWGARSRDGGKTWSANERIYRSPGGTICECCHPSATFDPTTGEAVVMWRNALEGQRDLWSQRLGARDEHGDPARLGTGHWKLEACPMAGGDIAVTAEGKTLSFWRRRHELVAFPGPDGGELPGWDGRNARIAAGPTDSGVVLLWSRPDGSLISSLSLRPEDGEPRVLGKGFNPWLASAPDGRGPVVVVYETEAEGATRVRLAVLARRARGG